MMREKREFNDIRSTIFKSLGDSTRLKILQFLKDGERCVCEIYPEFEKAQSTMSKHLSILFDSGILQRRVDGVRTFYSIKRPEVFMIIEKTDWIIKKTLKNTKKNIETLEASI